METQATEISLQTAILVYTCFCYGILGLVGISMVTSVGHCAIFVSRELTGKIHDLNRLRLVLRFYVFMMISVVIVHASFIYLIWRVMHYLVAGYEQSI